MLWEMAKYFMSLNEVEFSALGFWQMHDLKRGFPPSCNDDVSIWDIFGSDGIRMWQNDQICLHAIKMRVIRRCHQTSATNKVP